MAVTHNLGFPRIGAQRQLKFAVEAYWQGEQSHDELIGTARELRHTHWRQQGSLDFVPVGDFSLYDQVLDMSVTLGNLPRRVTALPGSKVDAYFRAARGRAPADQDNEGIAALEMTKWFDTNYHYLVPEFSSETEFSLEPQRLVQQVQEARQAGHIPKPVIIGPLSYLLLGKWKSGSTAEKNTAVKTSGEENAAAENTDIDNKLALLTQLVPVYRHLFDVLYQQGVRWIQVDEPALVMELDEEWQKAYEQVYERFSSHPLSLLLTTYFGGLGRNAEWVVRLPVAGLHVDAVRARNEVSALLKLWPEDKVLSLGVIDGRNIWKTDLNGLLDWLTPIHQRLQERLWLAPSCSLLHVPVDLQQETAMDPEIRDWLAFAVQKLDELQVLATALKQGRDAVAEKLTANQRAVSARQQSARVNNPHVAQAVAAIQPAMARRRSPYATRAEQQQRQLALPAYPTTTIGSFPQTTAIRQLRKQYRHGQLRHADYVQAMQREIEHSVREQVALGLDVLVHGEPERNDMVEYFGELLEGVVFSAQGWVQSYGSRCVKPPIIFGDISRPQPMTLEWMRFAKSLTTKPMKGMLTGPVTVLNWSFVRDDQPRQLTCRQLALAIREEVLDLERAGIEVIQIDEPALREGLPLKRTHWTAYLDWAVECFAIAANGVADETQIHTHMCYSEFNDIIEAIARMDADVITIETSRSAMELLEVFQQFRYPNGIGPGVYDVHAPNIPAVEDMVALLNKAAAYIPAERLWVNPDCGLKTRRWEEVMPALANMVKAAKKMRERRLMAVA